MVFDISSAGMSRRLVVLDVSAMERTMTVERFAKQLGIFTIAALFLGACPPAALAQGDHLHGAPTARQPLTAAQQAQVSALVDAVKQATVQFKDVANAGPDYVLNFGCVSGSDYGAMGLHFVNGSLVGDGEIDVNRPEILLYEPLAGGKMQLTGADYLVLAADWDSKHQGPPQLMGQLFHFFDSPNRFGLPPFYTLHVWAWKENPNGAFTNWNPNVSCDAFVDPSR
jgi:hypothetical protein